jgi:hypothetical protein
MLVSQEKVCSMESVSQSVSLASQSVGYSVSQLAGWSVSQLAGWSVGQLAGWSVSQGSVSQLVG